MIRPTLACLLLVMTTPAALVAQEGEGERTFLRSERRSFSVDVLTYQGDSAGLSRVDLYLELPYTSLQFVNQGGFFRASYELIVGVNDTAGRLLTEKVWSGRMEVDSIQEIRLRRPGEIVQKSIHLAPGRYVFAIRVRDIETNRQSTSRPSITVPDYGPGRWKVSDAMILKDLKVVEGRTEIVPNIGASISDVVDSFHVFLKLYNDLGVDSARLITQVVDRGGVTIRSDTAAEAIRGGQNDLLPAVRCTGLGVGEFTLSVRAIPLPPPAAGDGQAVDLAQTERTFGVRWLSAPIDVPDIDVAIDQMQYILEKEDLERMKSLPVEAKRDGWIDYWRKRDPSPGSERNELMEEYYSRVAYANRQFSHYTDGWKTDMGMVHIIFGAPSNIERHPFEINSKPYEIWTYYELNRQFIFVDATGFGDYRLQSPIWDVYQTRPR